LYPRYPEFLLIIRPAPADNFLDENGAISLYTCDDNINRAINMLEYNWTLSSQLHPEMLGLRSSDPCYVGALRQTSQSLQGLRDNSTLLIWSSKLQSKISGCNYLSYTSQIAAKVQIVIVGGSSQAS
jgi:hypothetical protein